MPLHLKDKLRKALHPNEDPSAPPTDRQGQFVSAGSLRDREPGASARDQNTSHAPVIGNVSAGDPLSASLGQLSLNDAAVEKQDPDATQHDALEIDRTRPNTSRHRDSISDMKDRGDSREGYARSATIASRGDPYSERVADRNISPQEHWTHSEDVDSQTTQLPAVTHETRIVNTHEIVERQVIRDIHNYDVIHRELPIIDVEVLPPRHFVPSKTGDSIVEISADQVPGGRSDDALIQRSIEQAFLKERLQPRSAGAS